MRIAVSGSHHTGKSTLIAAELVRLAEAGDRTPHEILDE
jgi:hypothetical protein